ncbi:MAG: glycosyltransferase [archaeon]
MKKVVLVVPVYNEEKILDKSIGRLHDYFKRNIFYDWEILIADNGSSDKTGKIADKLSERFSQVRVLHLTGRGRGLALREAWSKSRADALGYCDVDLATDISYIKPLFDAIIKDGYDISMGNRYIFGAVAKRDLRRLIYSKIYIWMVRVFFKTKITDFQCGFKAVGPKVVNELLKKVRDNKWFFDSELLLLAERRGYKIKQLPVKWQETRVEDSRVRVFDIFIDYLRGLIRLKGKLG